MLQRYRFLSNIRKNLEVVLLLIIRLNQYHTGSASGTLWPGEVILHRVGVLHCLIHQLKLCIVSYLQIHYFIYSFFKMPAKQWKNNYIEMNSVRQRIKMELLELFILPSFPSLCFNLPFLSPVLNLKKVVPYPYLPRQFDSLSTLTYQTEIILFIHSFK